MAQTDAGRILAERSGRALTHLMRGGRALRRGAAGAGFAAVDRLITMVQVRALIALAAHGGYSEAARVSGLTQPALHRAISDIERLSGLPMAVRQGRGIRLTEGAAALARSARLAVREIEAGVDEIAALQGRPEGRVAVGAMPLARARLLPGALAALHRERPTVQVSVVEGPYPELLSRLRDGDLDLLIGAMRQPPPADDVVQRPLFEDRLVIVAAADHPLAQSTPTLEDLAAYPWVLAPEGTPLREHWRAMFAERQAGPPPVAVDCSSVVAIRGLLLEGPWLTLLSPDQVRHEVQAGLLCLLGGPLERSRRVIGLTTRTHWRPTAAEVRLVALLEQGAEQRLPETE
jgi:LysR family transcriptional regulator, regulator for genes of the gallate degradation pathway